MDNVHALIIEDNANDASVLSKLLRRMEISHDTLYDSRKFTQKLQEVQTPDVIFLDLEIPGMSGYEVLGLIQSMPAFNDVPVVAYTSNAAQMRYAREAGFHSFLGKPLSSTEFPAQLDRILQDQPVWEVR